MKMQTPISRSTLPLSPLFFALIMTSACLRNQSSTATSTAETNDCRFDARFELYEEGSTDLFQRQLNHFKENYGIFGAPSEGSAGYTPYPYFVLPNDIAREPNSTLLTLMSNEPNSGLYFGLGKPIRGSNELTLCLQLLKYSLIRINSDSCRVEYSQVTDNDNQPVVFLYESQTRQWVRTTSSITEQWWLNLEDPSANNPLAYTGYFTKYNAHTLTDSDARYIYLGHMPGDEKDTISLFILNEPAVLTSSVMADGSTQTAALTNGVYTLTTNGDYSSSLGFFSETPVRAMHHNHTLIRACPPHCSR